MSSTTDEGFHEIQLNGKQLVFLFMAVTVVSVVIFLCGVLVGRGVGVQRASVEPMPALEPESAATAVPPPPASSAGTVNPEPTGFSDRLTRAQAPAEDLKVPPSQPPAETRVSAAAPETAPAAAPPTPAPVESAEPGGTGFAIQIAALGARAEADTMVRRLQSKNYQAYVLPPSAGAPSVFRVRVGKFKDRREAEAVAARLQKEEQFKPWIVR
jgi:cell division septation protein DedD